MGAGRALAAAVPWAQRGETAARTLPRAALLVLRNAPAGQRDEEHTKDKVDHIDDNQPDGGEARAGLCILLQHGWRASARRNARPKCARPHTKQPTSKKSIPVFFCVDPTFDERPKAAQAARPPKGGCGPNGRPLCGPLWPCGWLSRSAAHCAAPLRQCGTAARKLSSPAGCASKSVVQCTSNTTLQYLNLCHSL